MGWTTLRAVVFHHMRPAPSIVPDPTTEMFVPPTAKMNGCRRHGPFVLRASGRMVLVSVMTTRISRHHQLPTVGGHQNGDGSSTIITTSAFFTHQKNPKRTESLGKLSNHLQAESYNDTTNEARLPDSLVVVSDRRQDANLRECRSVLHRAHDSVNAEHDVRREVDRTRLIPGVATQVDWQLIVNRESGHTTRHTTHTHTH